MYLETRICCSRSMALAGNLASFRGAKSLIGMVPPPWDSCREDSVAGWEVLDSVLGCGLWNHRHAVERGSVGTDSLRASNYEMPSWLGLSRMRFRLDICLVQQKGWLRPRRLWWLAEKGREVGSETWFRAEADHCAGFQEGAVFAAALLRVALDGGIQKVLGKEPGCSNARWGLQRCSRDRKKGRLFGFGKHRSLLRGECCLLSMADRDRL